MRVFTFHFAKTPIITAIKAIFRPPTQQKIPGLNHGECLTKMTLGAPILSPKRMQLRHLTMFAAWESQSGSDCLEDQVYWESNFQDCPFRIMTLRIPSSERLCSR